MPVVGNGTRPLVPTRRLVELVGPAGVGKTTITHLLRRPHSGMHAAPGLWSLPRAPLGLNTLRLLPRLPGFYRALTRPVWEEMKQIIRLDTLYRVVGVPNGVTGPVLLDEGPVLALGWFSVYGDEGLRRPAFAAWLDRAVTLWAAALDVVVLLDAPDAVLVRRIRERAKAHAVKAKTDGEITAFVQTYRAALEAAVVVLRRIGGLTVVRLDTDDATPDTTAQRVRRALEGPHDSD